MEEWEVDELIKEVVSRFLPRIPERYVRGLERVVHAGEFTMAVDDLVLTLAANSVPVTASEHADLRRILEHLNRPTDPLDELPLVPQA